MLWLSVHGVSSVKCVRQNAKIVLNISYPSHPVRLVIPRPVMVIDITPMISYCRLSNREVVSVALT